MAKIVSRGDPIEPVYLNNLRVAAHGWGVISGMAVSEKGAGANMSVDVAAGIAWINERKVSKTSTTNVAITAAHASYDRYDLVVINSSGTISVVAGTAAATSYANDYDLETNNAILLAEVYVPATDTTIEDAQITDKQIISFVEEINFSTDIGLEEYSNHLGATDNFTETLTGGNGTATADTTNHEMDLSSGITIVGYSDFKTKDAFLIGSKPLIFNGKVQNIVKGGGDTRFIKIGFTDVWTGATGAAEAVFLYYSTTDTWSIQCKGGGSGSSNTITALANGDILTIVVISNRVLYYVNGILIGTHTSYTPTGSLEAGFAVFADDTGVTTAVSCSVDMLSMKRYV